MPIQRLFLTSLLLLTIALTSFCTNENAQKDSKKTNKGRTIDIISTLSFLDESNNSKATIKIAVAQTEQQRNLGLMDVAQLGADEGMIFLFEKAQPLSFWMANTPLPLDIFFVDEDSVIIRVHKNTQPYSNSQYGTEGQKARYVVETNAGFSITFDIKEGDRIRF
jgi:uncharacterized membrane protein (UPF0127 family)